MAKKRTPPLILHFIRGTSEVQGECLNVQWPDHMGYVVYEKLRGPLAASLGQQRTVKGVMDNLLAAATQDVPDRMVAAILNALFSRFASLCTEGQLSQTELSRLHIAAIAGRQDIKRQLYDHFCPHLAQPEKDA